jgi:hypothetical protein
MTQVDELLSAVERLTFQEQAEFFRRLHKWEDDEWDNQIAADHGAGKLDSLIAEARDDLKS